MHDSRRKSWVFGIFSSPGFAGISGVPGSPGRWKNPRGELIKHLCRWSSGMSRLISSCRPWPCPAWTFWGYRQITVFIVSSFVTGPAVQFLTWDVRPSGVRIQQLLAWCLARLKVREIEFLLGDGFSIFSYSARMVRQWVHAHASVLEVFRQFAGLLSV